jgi:extracellular factor (EF) 3-hydroxypalmitic acid methyl ester biosynthesis protein
MDNKLPVTQGREKDSFIVCRNSQGLEVRASMLRLTRYLVVFEVYNPYSILQLSEVLSEFKIIINDRLVYSGRAVVSNLVNTGILLICEATLDEAWLDVDLFSLPNRREKLQLEVADFLREWSKVYTVKPEFKVVVADMQTLLIDLRRWMEQVELAVRSQPSADRSQVERELIEDLRDPVLPALVPLFERFEETCRQIEEPLRPAHGSYVKRQIHPVVLCAPFFYRTFHKPLGYAGDYEMVNMMLRDPLEGSSMFAKLLNLFFLNTPPVVAHRNRISLLEEWLAEQVARTAREDGRRCRVFNLGCGPAGEIQRFLARSGLADAVEFTLMDFNDETLAYTAQLLEEIKKRHHRVTPLRLIKKSVHQILKEAGRGSAEMRENSYDLVYCAGLFDYLSDRICKRLMEIFYEILAPGGLLLASNVDSSNPSRNWMEYVVEWHLVYRDRKQLETLVPEKAPRDSWFTRAEPTGVNVFVGVHKPSHG